MAYTAAAVLAFENEGHFPGGGTLYSSTSSAAWTSSFSTPASAPSACSRPATRIATAMGRGELLG